MLRLGVIGYGYWGPNIVRNFVMLPKSRVTMLVDLRQENLDKVHAMYPTIDVTTDCDRMLLSPDVDAVAIATPLSTHYPLAKAALEAGKHVFVEKPMTTTSAQARELIALAQRKKLTLMVDHTFVYTGAVRKMRELITGGDLGDLFYFDSARINLGLLQQDTNVLWDLAPHDLSILSYLIDEPPQAVQAVGYRHVGERQEEIASMSLRYASGFHAHVRVSWLSPVKMRLTLIGGSKKMIVYDDVEPSDKVRVYDKGVALERPKVEVTALTPMYRAGDVVIPALDRTEALSIEARHFVDCIEKGERPLTDGAAGLRVVALLEAAQQSLDQQGAFVPLGA
jgi:predicted dehydrogenase